MADDFTGGLGRPTLERPDDELDLLNDLLVEAGIDAGSAYEAIGPRPAGVPVPLSFAQELVWLLDRASPGMTAYNMPAAYRLSGALDVPALERSLRALAERHETLRTRFVATDGEPLQLVDATAGPMLSIVDVGAVPAEQRMAEAGAVVQRLVRRPFDLAREHLLRATLVRLNPEEHLFVFETHHIVCDGWSIRLLFAELTAHYRAWRRGVAAQLPMPALHYGDYAYWQRQTLAGERLERLLGYWRAELAGTGEPLDVPTDYGRGALPSGAGARRTRLVGPDLLRRLKDLARARGATANMVLLAAYASVLHRYTDRERILVGSPVPGRSRAELENVVGYFANTVVQQANFAGDPAFSELLRRVRESCLGAYEHQDAPLEKLLLEARERAPAQAGAAALFDVVLTAQETLASAPFELEGVAVEPVSVDLGQTKFDLTLMTAEGPDGLRLSLHYRSDLFAPSTIDRFLERMETVLNAAANEPATRIAELPLLGARETAELDAWNATAASLGPFVPVQGLFEAQVRSRPQAVAVVCGDERLSYVDLNDRADRFARRLRELGVASGAPVALAFDRSPAAIVALLGVLKAGAAYVPLRPQDPPAHLARQLAESGARFLVAPSTATLHVPEGVTFVRFEAPDNVGVRAASSSERATAPDDPAYILFTSGSTGVPKGVVVTHGNIAHYMRALGRVLAGLPRDAAGDGLAAVAGRDCGLVGTLAADLGNTALFAALCGGGTLRIFSEEVVTEPACYAADVAEAPLDLLKITPSHLRALLGSGDVNSGLPRGWLILGGERLDLDFAERLVGAGRCRILNHYGPTETTVGACTFEVTAESLRAAREAGAASVPIGFALANVRLHVLDARRHAVPVGIPGELFIAGDGVAAGYVGRPDLTAERFVNLPGIGRVYRTGDLVRRLPSGALEFLGRADGQLKVRGYRVELGEIEHALLRHAAVAQAVAVAQGARGEDGSLAAYVALDRSAAAALASGDAVTPEAVRAWLGTQLPEHMVPATLIIVERFVLTPNGKIDRSALPAVAGTEAGAEFVAPRNAVERDLAALWAEVLKKDRVGVRDSFLDLGGHSLLAIRILGRISRTFGVRLPLRVLFEAPTVERLAEIIGAAGERPAPSAVVPEIKPAMRRRTSPSAPA